jgi:hypothetical protein
MKYVWIREDGALDRLYLAINKLGTKKVTSIRAYRIRQSRSGWRAITPNGEMLFQGESAKALAKTWAESQHIMAAPL